MELITWATILLCVYAAIAFIDGIIIHLCALGLHATPETRGEHALHSVRAALFAAALPLLFVFEVSGWLLWLGVGLILIDFGIGFWDAWIERDARAKMGGLGRAEYVVHVAASVIHGAMASLAIASRPIEAWSADAAPILGGFLAHGEFVKMWVLPGAVMIAIAHFALMLPKLRELSCPVRMQCCAPGRG